MIINFHILIELTMSLSLKENEEIDEMAIITIKIGDNSPAFAAASPRTIAPTIDIDVPIARGILVSLSFNISNISHNKIASTEVGKGTPSF